jgi:cytochrome c oxidase subunit 2
MISVGRLERRIIITSVAFALTLFALAALAVNRYHVGLPTCLTDIKPFQKGELITHSPTHYEVHYVARMWKFEPEDVMIPAGSTVDIYLSSRDVTHGLLLRGTDLNLMAVPGTVNYARVKLDQPRIYQLLCHEFCGLGHERMAATLRVVDLATFNAKQTEAAAPKPAESAGYRLLEAKDCVSCHTVDGQEGIGPTLKGIYEKKEKMAGGSIVIEDEAHLREAIMNPSIELVEGFDDLMPKPDLTKEELDEIIEYLKTLK